MVTLAKMVLLMAAGFVAAFGGIMIAMKLLGGLFGTAPREDAGGPELPGRSASRENEER